MKFIKTLLAGAALLAAGFGSVQAATVDGVTWDPNYSASLGDNDFTARYNMLQWYVTGANAIASTPNLNANPGLAILNPPGSIGDVLQGVGLVNTINGTSQGVFAPTGELTFVFGGYTVTGATTLTPGWLNIYYDATPDSSLVNGTGFNDGVLWLSLVGASTTFAGTALNAGSLSTYFNVTGGDAAPYFQDANIALFFGADAQGGAYAQFNAGSPYATTQGTLYSDSKDIPEPSSVALLGLGLAGLGFAQRRRKTASK